MPYIDGLPIASSVTGADVIALDQGGTPGIPGTATTRQAPLSLMFLGGGGAFLPLIGGTVVGQVTFSFAGVAVVITNDASVGGAFTIGGVLTANGAVTLSPASHNVVLSPTGTGVVTINPATAGTMDNVAVGQTTPLPANVTSLLATSTITPSQTAGVVGTTTNNNVQAGSIGEYISSTVLIGSAVSLTSGVTTNITTISLTAGDWDVWGVVDFTLNSATVPVVMISTLSTVSATLPTRPNGGAFNTMYTIESAGASVFDLPTGTMRLSLAVTTTVYLLGACSFSANVAAAYGFLGARRVR